VIKYRPKWVVRANFERFSALHVHVQKRVERNSFTPFLSSPRPLNSYPTPPFTKIFLNITYPLAPRELRVGPVDNNIFHLNLPCTTGPRTIQFLLANATRLNHIVTRYSLLVTRFSLWWLNCRQILWGQEVRHIERNGINQLIQALA
jgi:hypothetical protein